ncbi:MAG: DHH family phosphoesterase, partial [bacterium]|nr:DHH family phosphoesterase [bacterium]
YNIQGTHFNLIVSPRAGFPKLDSSQVSYSYTGGTIDFIFTIDTPNLNSLGQIYTENQAQIQGKTIINIDRHLVNDFFGTVNVVNKTSSSTSELVYQILTDLSIELDRDIATNLYGGIMAATNNFTSYSVTAQTFQTAADLLRMGALKKIQSRQPGMGMPRPVAPQPQPFSPRQFQSNGSLKEFEKMTPIEDIEDEPDDFEGSSTTAAPQDWLKPKIFKGKGLI